MMAMKHIDSSLARQLEKDQDALMDALQQLLRIPSVRSLPLPGALHGEGLTAALLCTPRIADQLGFTTRNLDGYIGRDCLLPAMRTAAHSRFHAR